MLITNECNSGDEPRIEDIIDQRNYRKKVDAKIDLDTLLGVLPKEARKVLAMWLYGYSDSEIAAKTGIDEVDISLRILPLITQTFNKLNGEA